MQVKGLQRFHKAEKRRFWMTRRVLPAKKICHRQNSQTGVALLLTLLVLTLMIVIVLQISYSTKITLKVAKNRRDNLQVYYAALGARNQAKVILSLDQKETETDSLLESWATDSLDIRESGDVEIKVQIVDEERKFNINLLQAKETKTDPEQDKEKKRQERMLRVLTDIIDEFREEFKTDIDGAQAEAMAKAIAEYIQSKPTKEEDKGIPKPSTKEGRLLTLDEILLIPGFDEQNLFDLWEEDEVAPGLSRFLTTWSNGTININTASLTVLRALFEKEDKNFADNIFEFREGLEETYWKEKKRRDFRQESEMETLGDQEAEEEEGKGSIFLSVDNLREENLVDDVVFNKVKDLMGVNSEFFSIYVMAKKGQIVGRFREVARRVATGDGETALVTILNEKRKEKRLIEEREEEEEEFWKEEGE